jgi:hypothetical protein
MLTFLYIHQKRVNLFSNEMISMSYFIIVYRLFYNFAETKTMKKKTSLERSIGIKK